jgi:hypothetical protein
VTLGWKEFTDGVVLPASDINGYLQQGVLVFDDAAARNTALAGSLAEGMYSYLKSDKLTYLYNGSQWIRVGQPDLDTEKNFQAFTGSGSTTVPDWATKMYYCIVRGGNNGSTNASPASGGAGGQVLQGNTSVTGGTSITVTVGGAASNSSVAIAGGSTFTASTTGASGSTGAGSNGTQPSAPFNVGFLGGGGGGSLYRQYQFAPGINDFALAAAPGGFGGGGSGLSYTFSNSGGALGGGGPSNGATNSGGGGGAGATGIFQGAAFGTGGSGIVLLYFS